MERKKLFAGTKEGKIRRKALKSKRSFQASKVQRREGISYESGVGLSNVLEIPVDAPLLTSPPDKIEHFKIIYFDTETTGLFKNDQIIQIAAFDGTKAFNEYAVPTVNIKVQAAVKTGLSVKKGELFLHGQKLATVSRESLLKDFLAYLEEIKNSSQESTSLILVGHNVLRFDAPKIEQLVRKYEMWDRFTELVYGYSDTLSIIKKKFPKKKGEKISFSEESLLKRFLPEEDVTSLHEALQDIKSLKKLVEHLEISKENLLDECQSIKKLKNDQINKNIMIKRKSSLQFLKEVVKPNVITKMAKVGITKKSLLDAYQNDKKSGVKTFLSMNVNKRARLTTNREILNAISDKIKKLYSENKENIS